MTTGSPAALADDRAAGEFDARADRAAQLRAGALVVAVLVAVGALLGVIWEDWSPPGPAGAVLRAGIQPDETEAFVGADGRYALLTLIVGLAAGAAGWYLLRAVRGPLITVALAVGGLAGALLTDLVGWALRGDGTTYRCGSETGQCIDHLRLGVHMHALWFGEAVAALLVYSLFVAFAVADDLGRPEPRRRAAIADLPEEVSPYASPAPYAPAPPGDAIAWQPGRSRPEPRQSEPQHSEPQQSEPQQPEHQQPEHQASEPASLGRTEAPAEPDGSVGSQRDLQDGGRHGDAPGVAQ